MKKAVLLVLLCLLFSLKTNAQEACCINLSANQIMSAAVTHTRENDRLKQARLIYNEVSTQKEFNYKGDKLSAKEEAETIDGLRSRLAGFDLSIGELLQILVVKHQFSEPEEVILNNKSYWLINFYPKSGLIDNTTENKFLNRLQGKIWLDVQNNSLWRVEAQISESRAFSFRTWKLLGLVPIHVKSFKLTFQQIEYMGIMVENSIQVEAKYVVLSETRTRKYDFQYSNYRLK